MENTKTIQALLGTKLVVNDSVAFLKDLFLLQYAGAKSHQSRGSRSRANLAYVVPLDKIVRIIGESATVALGAPARTVLICHFSLSDTPYEQ